MKSKEQITYEDLKKLIAENKAVFIKPLVFVLACILIYFVVVPFFVLISQLLVFSPGESFVKILIWTLGLWETLRGLWKWEL